MRPLDNAGHELKALFCVENATDLGFELILESRGGAEGVNARNQDYSPALRLLLERLSDLSTSLTHIDLASSVAERLPVEQRRLLLPGYPNGIHWNDIQRLQTEIQTTARRFGQADDASGGNSTKRIRIFVQWHSPVVFTNDQVEAILARRELNPGFAGSRYRPLGDLLWRNLGSDISLSLEQLVDLLGDLPADAGTHQFWANAVDYDRARRGQWLNLGYRAFFRPEGRVQFVGPRLAAEIAPTDDPNLLAAQVEVLLEQSSNVPPVETGIPAPTSTAEVRVFARRSSVIAYVLGEAGGRCDCCEQPAPFKTATGRDYLEVHHLRPLAEGGPDDANNAVALCPNCHRRLHSGADAGERRTEIIQRISRLRDHPRAEVPTGG